MGVTRFSLVLKQVSKNKRGFTLIELLAVVLITAVISVVSVGVFVNSQVRGNKARAVSVVRQQGVSITDQLDFLIRGSRGIPEGALCTSGLSELTLETSSGENTVLSLVDSRVASNSTFLSSDTVRVSALAFSCIPAASIGGANISYSFIVEVGDQIISPDSYFSQEYQSNVNIRSY